MLLSWILYNPIGTAPRNWELAVGYDGTARFVAFYWDPIGDEAVWDDGLASSDGNWHIYLDVVDALPLTDEQHALLGSSDNPASHRLVLDRETRKLYLLPKQTASTLLRGEQHPPAPTLSPEEIEAEFQKLHTLLEERRAFLEGNIPSPCRFCNMNGWTRAEDGGYDPCPKCGGQGFILTGNTEQDEE